MATSRRQILPPPPVEEFVGEAGFALVELWVPGSAEAFFLGAALDRLIDDRLVGVLRIGRVNGDTHPETCVRYHADAPSLLLFRDGIVIARHRGLARPTDLARWLEGAIAQTTADDSSTQTREGGER